MIQVNNKRLLILLVSLIAVIATSLLFLNQKPKNNEMFTLKVTLVGNQKYFNVESSVDKSLGVFYGGNTEVLLTKSRHYLRFESVGYADEHYLIDATKGTDSSIKLDFTKKEDSLKIVPPIEGEYSVAVPRFCSFFASKTWALCSLSFGEVALRNTENKWDVQVLDEYITQESLTEKEAPEELINFMEE